MQLRYMQRETHRAISAKWNPTDGTALLLFQSSLQKGALFSAQFFLSVVSSCHFLFSSSPLHAPSELLIYSLLGLDFFPLRSFACSSRYPSKGENSQEVNHVVHTQAPDHIRLHRGTSFPFLISDPAVLLWEFVFGLISNLYTFPRKTQQEACLQKPKCIIRQGQTWHILLKVFLL